MLRYKFGRCIRSILHINSIGIVLNYDKFSQFINLDEIITYT